MKAIGLLLVFAVLGCPAPTVVPDAGADAGDECEYEMECVREQRFQECVAAAKDAGLEPNCQ